MTYFYYLLAWLASTATLVAGFVVLISAACAMTDGHDPNE